MPKLTSELAEGVRIASDAIWARKVQALLTTLGVIIGIVSVTSMFTVINGIETELDKSVSMIGDDALFVDRTPWFSSFEDWFKMRSRPPISEEIAPVVRRQSRYATAAVPLVRAGLAAQRGRDRMPSVLVDASTADLPDTGGTELDGGRFFSETEDRAGRAVAVIGADVVDTLFPAEDPVGKTFRLGGERFTVVGVLTKRGKFLGQMSFDERAIIPLSTYKRLYDRDPDLSIKVAVEDPADLDAAANELYGIVRIARGLGPLDDDDFAINRQEQFKQFVQVVRVTTYAVGLFLTALSLIVGGIGVMNIMFVSVKERTREIGVRKALGATKRAILFQFLVEAVLICLVGGGVGVGLAALVALGLDAVFTASLDGPTVLLAFGLCSLVGIVFGLAPAWQAANARPIDALRYE